jgi:hypothetical protein
MSRFPTLVFFCTALVHYTSCNLLIEPAIKPDAYTPGRVLQVPLLTCNDLTTDSGPHGIEDNLYIILG